MSEPQTAPVEGARPGDELRATLDRAVAAGVITAEQAGRIAELAATPQPQPAGDGTAGRRGAPVLAEVLGYLGGAVTIVTAIVLGNELWDSLAVALRVLVLVAVAAAAVAAGAGLRDHRGPAGRLAGFLWLLAVVALAGTVAVATDGLLAWDERDTALAACLAGLVAAAVTWWLHREHLQHLALFVAVLLTLLAVLARLEPDRMDLAPFAVWLLGLGWLAVTASGRIPPESVGWIAGGVAAAFGLLFVDGPRSPWLVVAVLTGVALVAVGVRIQRWPVVAIGIVGLLFAVPIMLGELFGTALLPVWIALGIGLALLLGGVVVLRRPPARRRSRLSR
ncbi:MAG TPA: hypothetical protein VNO83_09995 [Pseudonocardia sp.]|nr:hypothetical protein [Pseudonocardia sp.]